MSFRFSQLDGDSPPPPPTAQQKPDRFAVIGKIVHAPWFVPTALFLLAVAMFGGVLFSPRHDVLSNGSADLATEFVYWRRFAFDQLRHGHIALWNPYVFSGTPFLGGWQAAIFYPPDWIYLVLPLDKAINWEIAIHTFLAGLGMSMWARYHRMHPTAALLAGTMTMFGGPFFLHVSAGHLATLDTMAWAPFILLAVDGLLDRPSLKWGLAAAGALSMALLAGHPQTLFNTLVTVFLYVALRIARAPQRLQTLLGLAGALGGMALITAAQIVAGLAAAAEGTRRSGVPYSFASMFSFPPENVLTAIVPGFFGNMVSVPYWGRCYYWEMCLFLGVTGVILACYGLFRGDTSLKRQWLAMIVLLMWIAFAAHTPLFTLLYHFVPGFNRFRSHSKFIFPASLFITLAAAAGLDALVRLSAASVPAELRIKAAKTFAAGAGWTGIGIGLLGVCLLSGIFGDGAGSVWQRLLLAMLHTHESSLSLNDASNPDFTSATQTSAATGCLVAAGIAFVVAALAWRSITDRRTIHAIAIVGILELFVFAHGTLVTFDLGTVDTPQVQQTVAADPGDYRLLNPDIRVNQVMDTKSGDLWGYDPTILGRYAEYLTFSQGVAPDTASMYLNFNHDDSPLLRLFRPKYIVHRDPNQGLRVETVTGVLPHVLLVPAYNLIAGRDSMFATMAHGFDFAKTVCLESTPSPAPTVAGSTGSISITQDYPGSMTIHADIPQPSLALITDSYSRNWTAQPLAGSSQNRYQVMPADYAAMAIPLDAGHHVIRLQYVPAGFVAAEWVSLLSVIIFLLLTAGVAIRARRDGESAS